MARYKRQTVLTQLQILSFLCLEALFEGLYLVFYAIDAVFDGCPNRPGPGSHGKVERLGYFFPAGAGLLRGREACRRSGGAPGGQHGSQRHKLTGFFIHCAVGIINSCKLFDFHNLPPYLSCS